MKEVTALLRLRPEGLLLGYVPRRISRFMESRDEVAAEIGTYGSLAARCGAHAEGSVERIGVLAMVGVRQVAGRLFASPPIC